MVKVIGTEHRTVIGTELIHRTDTWNNSLDQGP